MPTLQVVAFNAHDNYGRSLLQIINRVPLCHILAIPEAYQEGDTEGQEAVDEAKSLHPKEIIADVAYNDTDSRKDRHHLVLAGSREVVERIEPIQLGGRTALRASLKSEIDVIGVHLDDRREDVR